MQPQALPVLRTGASATEPRLQGLLRKDKGFPHPPGASPWDVVSVPVRKQKGAGGAKTEKDPELSRVFLGLVLGSRIQIWGWAILDLGVTVPKPSRFGPAQTDMHVHTHRHRDTQRHTHTHARAHARTNIDIYIYTYICIYRERERERDLSMNMYRLN